MLSFESLNISDDIMSVISKYDVDFVFQPIYSKFGTVVGHEALMRPNGKFILDFIEDMRNEDKLHELELLTFFGATYVYKQRGYDTLLSINSFPSEAFSKEEALEYSMCFRPIKEKLIVEILEYTEEKHWTWKAKREHIDTYKGIEVALDDFGTGYNDDRAVDYYKPDMIKIDRTLISEIDKSEEKQLKMKQLVSDMHKKSVTVLAEGIETEEEYEFLKSADVDFFQGYYLGRPS